MRRQFFIWIMLLLTTLASFAQSKEDLQAQKQKAFDEIKLARELMEKTTKERVGSLQRSLVYCKGESIREQA